MPSLYLVQPRASGGGQIAAADINQLVNTLTGNQNTPVNVRNTDPIAYTQQLQNTDAAGKAQLIYGPDGTTVLLRVQGNGVVASPDGTAATPIVTTTHTQTLTGKTLTSPVVGGAGGTPAGTLGFSGTKLFVGDGTVNESVNVGPWTTWAPIVTQPGALTVTVNAARYDVSGKRITVFLLVTIGQVGTTGNDIVVTSPVAPLNVGAASCVGSFQYRGATFRAGSVIAAATNTFKLQVDNNVGFLGTLPALALAVGDTISLTATYEAA